MRFKINGELLLARQLQEIFLSKQDLLVKFNNTHEFKTKIHATQVFMDQYGKISFLAETGELMPSSKGYKRNFKQERKTAKKRGETGVGSKSGDATRHRARRKVAKTTSVKGKDVHHKKGMSNKRSNLKAVSVKKNRSAGGKIGNRKGKAAGGRKGK